MARHYSTRRYNGPHRMTPARRAALRKAQLASAKKRRRRGIAIGVTVAGVGVTGSVVARHKYSGSHFNVSKVNVNSRHGAHLSDKAKKAGTRKLRTPGLNGSREGAMYGVRRVSKKGVRRDVTYTHHSLKHRKTVLGSKTHSKINLDNIHEYHPTSGMSFGRTFTAEGKPPKETALSKRYGAQAVATGPGGREVRVPLLGNYRRGQKGNKF